MITKLTLVMTALALCSVTYSAERRTSIRKWAKTNEKRAAVLAGGIVSLPQSGEKQDTASQIKKDETKIEKKEEK